MSVDFTAADFFAPLAIARFRRLFSSLEHASSDRLAAHEEKRLRSILEHAVRNVPHYRKVFSDHGLTVDGACSRAGLSRLPVLGKSVLRAAPASLHADDAARFRPVTVRTSGSSGEPLAILLDRATNAQEFAYYWRYWNWSGYRLGDRFVEFSSSFFAKRPHLADRLVFHQRGTGRLLVNSLRLSRDNVPAIASALLSFRARYLKALPSVAAAFAHFIEDLRIECPFPVIFTTGETLRAGQRRRIERAFGGDVRDSYGHMERAAAASECEAGSLHINSDYGLLELDPLPVAGGPPTGLLRARILATGFYNHSMPLIRYDTGDVAEYSPGSGSCACGRAFPVITRIEGRVNDVVRTPEGAVIATAFLAFDGVAGLRWGQIVQETLEEIKVRVLAADHADRRAVEANLLDALRRYVGPSLRIRVTFVPEEAALGPGRKHRSVISRLPGPPDA